MGTFRQKLLRLFDAIWLPALLFLSTSWLYAPWLYHVGVGHLDLISTYEASAMPFSGIFRAGDILGATVLLLAIWRVRLTRHHPSLAWALIVVAALMIVDDIFVADCIRQCTIWVMYSGWIHDMESVASAVILGVATMIDVYRRRSIYSWLFLVAQGLVAVLAVIAYTSPQYLIFGQFIYQTLAVVWMAHIVQRSMPQRGQLVRAQLIRLIFAVLVFLMGLIELISAFHLRAYGILNDQFVLHAQPVWLAEHSVVAGVVMLYVARFVYKGERRAALIIGVILATLFVKYALITPNGLLLLPVQILLFGLWGGWGSFDRNTGIPPLVSKLKNLGITLGGVLVALLILFTLAFATGHSQPLIHDSQHLFDASADRIEAASAHGNRLRSRIAHTREVGTGLGLSLLALTLWTLFRPASQKKDVTLLSRTDITRLLEAHASSSEDYFKLWPGDKSYFTTAGIDGFIAYKQVSSTLFALADPICTLRNRRRLLRAFNDYCRMHGWSVCFLLVGSRSSAIYEATDLNMLKIGSNAMVDIQQFLTETTKDKWWRWQLNRATKSGMQHSVATPPYSTELLAETRSLSDAWLERAGHKEQGFAMGYYDESYLQTCALHLLRNETGELVAFANQLPVFNNLTHATVDLIRFRPDTDGAMPVLIACIIKQLSKDPRYTTFDLGFVPLATVENIAATIARRIAAGRFSAAGLEQFKRKFRPQWQPQYLAYNGDLIDLTILLSRLQKVMKDERDDT